MCFSAGASFTAAAVLGVAGVVSVNKASKSSQLMFASIPLLFSLQQVSEGLVWLSLTHSSFESYRHIYTYIFFIFAQVVWPTWVPLSFFSMETNANRKKIMRFVLAAGITDSLLLTYRMTIHTVAAEIDHHHIHYVVGSPEWIIVLSSVLYLISTLASPFLSTLKHTSMLGIVMMAALITTELFYTRYLVSVWCFFAAVLSIIIMFILQKQTSDSIPQHAKA